MGKLLKIVENPTAEQRAVADFLRSRPGLTINNWAQKAGISEGTLRRFLTTRGGTMTHRTYLRLATAAGVTVDEILGKPQRPRVPLLGYIGAGAVIHLFADDTAHQWGESVEAPRELEQPEQSAALEIRGDSMLPLENGWIVFYDTRHSGVTVEEIGKLCVVRVRGGGILIKKLRRGYTPGRFNLESWNAPLMEDVEVEWAAPVRAIQPR